MDQRFIIFFCGKLKGKKLWFLVFYSRNINFSIFAWLSVRLYGLKFVSGQA